MWVGKASSDEKEYVRWHFQSTLLISRREYMIGTIGFEDIDDLSVRPLEDCKIGLMFYCFCDASGKRPLNGVKKENVKEYESAYVRFQDDY